MDSITASSETSPSSPSAVFDPHAAFIAEDGLEYANLADYICARPVGCFRNDNIRAARARGLSEESIRQWIKGYDGDDPTPSHQIGANEAVERHTRANFAVGGRFGASLTKLLSV